ncbi:hypothetical protein GGS23DRAFT_589909 [Durotheca rogersii]|uniref:uncharacterized protein n=1 Tax=Durotheca rogersii TaxID=419775 RepID=UPI00221FEC3B|nr:uncharacterized protein GGS23DRAFT_589909 [Durotheca rogersii]KAI5855120.1 hypothetical protein GGS23DRAFT_589909 [Durotheca rogersii]
MSRPLRSNCDRCHSQKLKCPKQLGLATCTRYLKAGASCIFSLAKPNARRTVPTSAYLSSDLDMQFDWPSLDLETALITPPGAPQGAQPAATYPVGLLDAADEDPRYVFVHQLTALAVDIDKVSLGLSSISQIR